MVFRIVLDSDNHSFTIERQINERADLTAKFIEETITDSISDNYEFDEEEQASIDAYPIQPIGYYDDKTELSDDVYQTATDALATVVSPFEVEYYLDGDHIDLGIEIDINAVIRSIIADHLYDRQCDCQSNIDIGMIILSSLERFYTEGQWNEGFLREDGVVIMQKDKWPSCVKEKVDQSMWKDESYSYKPIIWFGMKDELPIQCWTLGGNLNQREAGNNSAWTEDSWKDMWFDFDDRWAILLDNDDAMYTWLFWECAEQEPDIDSVIAACPVQLVESDSTTELYNKIETHFSALVHNA